MEDHGAVEAVLFELAATHAIADGNLKQFVHRWIGEDDRATLVEEENRLRRSRESGGHVDFGPLVVRRQTSLPFLASLYEFGARGLPFTTHFATTAEVLEVERDPSCNRVVNFSVLSGSALCGRARHVRIREAQTEKAVKYGMIGEGKTPKEKFELIKSLGFDGVEMDSPSDLKVEEAAKAAKEVGIVIHGVVNSTHWQIRMSDPDPAVRGKAIENMKTALKDAKTYGAETVLLVPGAVRDADHENYEQVFERSQAVRQGVHPAGRGTQDQDLHRNRLEQVHRERRATIEYVDAFKNPIVGGYFDISNMIKFGMPPAEWIRKLGKRMYKFDFKGYSNKDGFKVAIGDGDENWPEVLKALDEVGYCGWATSEVKGGDRKWLADVAKRMDKVLGLAS